MDERQRPLVIAFDVMETLFPIVPLEARFTAAGLAPGTVRLWFERTLRNGFALSAGGGYRPFAEVAVGALLDVDGHRLTEPTVRELVGAIAELEPRPEAAAALRLARTAGPRVVALTNGSADTTGALLGRTGLDAHVERVISADEVRRWKPAPEPYLHAAAACGVPRARLALVAAHAWDVEGARRAGLTTGWSSHLEGLFPQVFEPADVSGADLVDVVEGLLER
ncbi:2-haloacid dehalogenase [Nocardiopsis sp. Huas11]|uniref:HAD-IA family hydrolase n=1 Tax=Nocardiopsis sp. Huas11 TaxID=2183912 RepID=UPI000EAEA47C|nr:HAD-IA family hydrolase [Nocardiopsis sp. Huas11]RKS09125.1 2-haloacid dehalogenase [Nocardiopsis sp. Huas11]